MTNFPAAVTRLIGRTAAVARLRDLMSAYRVVTLTGPGGIGKTSLALKVARGVVGEFADGGWLVELASLSDPALVPAVAAGVLKLPIGPNKRHARSRRARHRGQKAAPGPRQLRASHRRSGDLWPKRSWRTARMPRSSRRAAKPSDRTVSMSIAFRRWTFPLPGGTKRTTF